MVQWQKDRRLLAIGSCMGTRGWLNLMEIKWRDRHSKIRTTRHSTSSFSSDVTTRHKICSARARVQCSFSPCRPLLQLTNKALIFLSSCRLHHHVREEGASESLFSCFAIMHVADATREEECLLSPSPPSRRRRQGGRSATEPSFSFCSHYHRCSEGGGTSSFSPSLCHCRRRKGERSAREPSLFS